MDSDNSVVYIARKEQTMIKRYCDGCGKELCADEDYHIQPWWTLTRHDGLDITIELCDECFEKRMKGADDK